MMTFKKCPLKGYLILQVTKKTLRKQAKRFFFALTTGINFKTHLIYTPYYCCVVIHLERAMRIELTTKAWEALVLPLNYARDIL